jgi:hypothetical protein
MSLDDQSVTIPPSAVDSSLLSAQLNGTKLNGYALENKHSSPTSERLQVINDEKNFTLVLLTRGFIFLAKFSMTRPTEPTWPLR